MQCFFETGCRKCGAIDEARFTFAGPHIKQVCNACGFYVKFFDKAKIPDIKDLRLKIWHISDQNIDLINKCKKDMEFVEGMKGLDGKMMYWKLYLHIRHSILNPAS
jgi:hypothetical protein